MNGGKADEQASGIELEYEFGEPPQKVWRALSVPEFRETWLPGDALADPEATTIEPGEEVRYRMRDDAPPFLESTVTFKISPNGRGGTRLRITHEPTDVRFIRPTTATANDNTSAMRLATSAMRLAA